MDQMDDKKPDTKPVTITAVGRKKQPNRTVFWRVMIVALCFLAGIGGGVLAGRLTGSSALTVIDRSNNSSSTISADDGETIAAVAAKVSPSVVSIVTSSKAMSFYGSVEQTGAGTGIIVSEDGYVMTNSHVIESASSVSVVTADGTTYSNVTVIGSDPLNDIAFLKIPDVSGMAAAELGDSSSIKIGQQVIAIGNALGQYQNTVTSGIISGTGRPITASSSSGQTTETLTDLIQTDAAINSGNSGGPLVNSAGQIIGINTAVASNADGIGFAIPINSTKGVLDGVLSSGKISRAYLGVNYLSITPDVAKEYSLSVTKGAYVYAAGSSSAVVSGGPAEKAGLKTGDIITMINDMTIGDQGSMSSLIGEYRPGDTVQLTVLRGSSTLSINVQLGAYQ